MIEPASELQQPSAAPWLAGGGEMGALIRARQWADTPLGPLESWPQSLRSAVSILLPSKAQIVLFWGPQLIALYNDAYRPVFGSKHPNALGMPASNCWREVWHVLEPLFRSVLTTGEAFWAKDHPFALERHGYLEETYFDVSYDPVRDESGRVGGLFCIVSETTGRVIGERRLATLRDLGHIRDGAASQSDVLRKAVEVLAKNRADLPFVALYGCEAGSIRLAAMSGLGAAELHSPWPLGSGTELLLVERPGGIQLDAAPWPEATTRAAVLRIATPGAEPYGYLVAGISPRRPFDPDYRDFLHLACSNIAHALAAVHALEDERRRAAALAELDRAKTAFFSNVSHEFRTPLTLMLGPLEDLLTRAEGSLAPQDRALVSVAQRNSQRLLRLVNTLLDFARIEAGRAHATYQPSDVAALTSELASNFRSACEQAGIRLTVDCPALPEALYVDREMWEKLVLNLLSNAFKFTFAGEIAVRLRDAGAHVELTVSDTGSGIPAASLPHVFERFYRVEDARGRSHEGSGIGLALVNELVKLHAGSIEVHSEANVGTTFTVLIPKGSAHLPPEQVRLQPEARIETAQQAQAFIAEALGWLPPQAPAASAVSFHAGERILLADDNADLREYASRLLGEHYTVHAVADGRAALEAARELRPDLIILDVMMPQLDGFETMRELRADPQLRATPILLLSARAGEESRIDGLGRGADDYVTKPFSARELLVRVGTLLRATQLRRQAEEARAQFATLLNVAPLGVYLVDEDFRIAAVNPRARPLFGDIPDLIGRDFAAVVHTLWPASFAEELLRQFRHTLESGEPHVVSEQIEQRLDRQMTEYFEWQIHRIPLPANRRGVVCYLRDISRSVLARAALQEADSRKDEFLATLSHELRNPLAPLRSSLEVLKRSGTNGERASVALEIMQRQVSHLVRLVDDLLEVSRITRGTFELRKEPVRLDVILRNALEASEPLLRAAGHRVSISAPAEPIVLLADPVRLAQVFGNLLNNAANYSPHNSEITMEVSREAREAVVRVRDTGDGIEPAQLPRLFDMFTRAESSATRNQSGLGIGLALVRRLTQMHGGTVEAHSDGLGKGSCFTVRLPLSSTHPVSLTSHEHASTALSSLRALVIDDCKDAAASLAMLLETMGAEVRIAHDGRQGLAEYRRFRPLLVLLDLGMPGMDGFEVAAQLRALGEQTPPCLVAVTGWGQDEDRRRVSEAGFDHHLVKPASLNELHALIAALQAQRPLAGR